ncbi:MAG: formylmethanofuran dehydrogenase subunit C [Nitrososphaerales archaeon]
MREIKLSLKEPFIPPLDCSVINTDNFYQNSLEEIKALKIWRGNREVSLEDVFSIHEENISEQGDIKIYIEGDLSKARRIGQGMSFGEIIIKGNYGLYLGAHMKGGKITVYGDCGSWVGVEMEGGFIEVKGNVGDYLASSYRGTTKGMKGGTILVNGNCGVEACGWMSGGIVKVMGNSGIFPGIHMKGGIIYVKGDCAGRAGANMIAGRVIINGKVDDILPSFKIEEVRGSVKVGDEKIEGPFYVFVGDLSDEGDGRLFVHVNNNPHLKKYEEYIP